MRKVSTLAMAMTAALALAAGCNDKRATAPPTATGKAAGAGGSLKGRILEKIPASSYSYLRLQTAGGETWAAVPATAQPVGAEVEVVGTMVMDGFESKTLGRKFDRIVFGELGGGPGPGATPEQIARAKTATGTPPTDVASLAGLPPGNPAAEGAGIKVDKATGPNAKTVAEVWAEKARLKDAKVTVKAKVVKLNSGILGKNWLHVRDGSGSDEAKDNDLTVTTTDDVAVGDVVTVDGTLRVDMDFGAGYRYPAIVENASVKKATP